MKGIVKHCERRTALNQSRAYGVWDSSYIALVVSVHMRHVARRKRWWGNRHVGVEVEFLTQGYITKLSGVERAST